MNIGRWRRMLEKLGVSSEDSTYQKLVSAYSEKHRFYHTAAHIEDCLSHFDSNIERLEFPESVEIAIWFHDAVYRPFSKTNELDSANWAVEFLTSVNVVEEIKTRVYRLILATLHNGKVNTKDESVLVDLDLAVLGSDPDTYTRFEDNIRKEYKYVPGFVFRKKRANLLSAFLNREAIYSNENFRDLYETNARKNLENAVARLQG